MGKLIDNQIDKISKKDKVVFNKMSEVASLMYLTNSSKKCPNKVCKARIQKTEGCNKMQCSSCNTKFCWVCLKIIDSYAHFDESPQCNMFG